MIAAQKIKNNPIPFVSADKFYQFPLKLRQIAVKIYDSGEHKSLKEYCEEFTCNWQSMKTMIARYRKKGMDFNDLLGDIHKEKLKIHRPRVYRALIEGCIEGSVAHMQLYFRLMGELKIDGDAPQSTTNTQHNYIISLRPSLAPHARCKCPSPR